MTRRSIRGGAVATVAVLGLVLVLALGLAACGTATSDGGGSSPSSSSDQPKQGGTLTLSYLTEPSSLDPAIAWNVIDWQIEHDIYQGFLQYAHESGAGRHRAHPLPRHRGAEHRQRRHLGRRQDVHLPPAHGRQVPAAGQSRGDGRRLQVQLRAHDERAARARHVLLHGRRRRRRVHEGQGRRDHRLQGRRRLHRRDHAQEPRTSRSSTPSPWTSATSCPRSGSRSGASSSTATRWAPARSSSRSGRPAARSCSPATRSTGKQGKPYLDTIDYQLSFSPSTALLKLAARRGGRARRRRPGRRPVARPGRPQVEAADLLAAAGRDQLHVHERAR